MKLLHKLLPAATVASIAAIVTPLVTSCAQTIFAEWEWSGVDPEWKAFHPSIPMREEKIIPQDDNENVLTNDYYKCISERPLIFAEDLVYAFADYQQPEDSKSNDAPVWDVQTRYVKVIPHSFDIEWHSIEPLGMSNEKVLKAFICASYDVIWTANIQYTDDSTEEGKGEFNAEIDKRMFKVKNFLFRLVFETDKANVLRFPHWTTDDGGWKITMPRIIEDKNSNAEGKKWTFSETENIEYTNKNAEHLSPFLAKFFDIFIYGCLVDTDCPNYLTLTKLGNTSK